MGGEGKGEEGEGEERKEEEQEREGVVGRGEGRVWGLGEEEMMEEL